MMTASDDRTAAFNDLAEAIENALTEVNFVTRQGATVPAPVLAELFQGPAGPGRESAHAVTPQLDDRNRAAITQCLTDALDGYITDELSPRIGYSLARFTGGSSIQSVSDFADVVIRASALLGTTRAVDILHDWMDDKPIRYSQNIALAGLSSDRSTTRLSDTVMLSPMPTSESEMAARMPASVSLHFGVAHFAGRMMLTIEREARPALFVPSDSPFFDIEESPLDAEWPGSSLDDLCNALSLACNTRVDHDYYWKQFGDLGAFSPGDGGGSWRPVTLPKGPATLNLWHWTHAMDILDARKRLSDQEREQIDRAIRRWWSSIGGQEFTDCLIDLRIALETLYLGDGNGELSFRLATRGAWHLGDNYEERQRYWKILRRAYDLASKVVHGASVESDIDNLFALQNAAALCRAGILRRLEEGKKPDWNNLILGKPPGVLK